MSGLTEKDRRMVKDIYATRDYPAAELPDIEKQVAGFQSHDRGIIKYARDAKRQWNSRPLAEEAVARRIALDIRQMPKLPRCMGETCAKADSTRGRYTPLSGYDVLVRQCIDCIFAEHEPKPHPLAECERASGSRPADQKLLADRVELLGKAGLTTGDMDVLVKFYHLDWTEAEIAEWGGESAEAVTQRRKRANRKLRSAGLPKPRRFKPPGGRRVRMVDSESVQEMVDERGVVRMGNGNPAVLTHRLTAGSALEDMEVALVESGLEMAGGASGEYCDVFRVHRFTKAVIQNKSRKPRVNEGQARQRAMDENYRTLVGASKRREIIQAAQKRGRLSPSRVDRRVFENHPSDCPTTTARDGGPSFLPQAA